MMGRRGMRRYAVAVCSPMTGVDLRSKDVVPNFALKSLIAARLASAGTGSGGAT